LHYKKIWAHTTMQISLLTLSNSDQDMEKEVFSPIISSTRGWKK